MSRCRTCLANDPERLSPFDNEIKTVFEECMSTKVEANESTNVICEECKRILFEFHTFKLNFMAIDGFFKEHTTNSEAIDAAHPSDSFSGLFEVIKTEADFDVLSNVNGDALDVLPIDVVNVKCEVKKRTKSAKAQKTRSKTFNCHICSKTFKNAKSIVRHYEVHYGDVSDPSAQFSCIVCDNSFPFAEQLNYHITADHAKRKRVEKAIKYENDDISDGESGGDKTLSCPKCTKTFKKQYYLNHHLKTRHSDGDHAIGQCPVCQVTFFTFGYLTKHMKYRHADVEPVVKCEECPMRFFVQSHLERHKERTHLATCPHCGEHRRRHLHRHIKYCQKKPNAEKIKCPRCDKLLGARSLYQHLRVKHSGKDYRQICNICGIKVSNVKTHAIRHQRDPSEPKLLKCRYCGEKYENLSQIREHQNAYHSDEKLRKELKYECRQCGKKFAERQSYNSHCKYTHSDVYAFKCSVCSKSFKMNNQLTVHMRSHKNERPYACTYCDKRFFANTKLKLHIRTHTGEKPFECKICMKSFARNDALKIHMKSHYYPSSVSDHQSNIRPEQKVFQ